MHNVLINLDDALLAIATMEGEGWLEDEMRLLESGDSEHPHWDYSVAGAIAEITRWTQEGWDDMGAAIVYGAGGWNRWAILQSGEVRFVEHNASYPKERTISRAKELGFELW